MLCGGVFSTEDLLDKVIKSLTDLNPPTPKFSCIKLCKKLQRAKSLRNSLRNNLPTSFPDFFKALRKVASLQKEISILRTEHDFWRFAKDITNASPVNKVECTAEAALEHFRSTYSDVDSDRPSQIPIEISDHPITLPISNDDIVTALAQSNLKSAAGPDEICYGDLSNNPDCIPLLRNLYNKILETGSPPSHISGWASAEISLIFKNKGSSKEISNYRPIAVTSAITRLFHKILAKRLETHLRALNYFDERIQKGFLTGLHGCMDHSFIIQDITEDALQTGSSAFITLYDLRDAFGSVPHQLIKNILVAEKLPLAFTNYIINYYNMTEACLKGPWGVSAIFPIKKGVLQGDPLSPLLFNMCFNNVIKTMTAASQEFKYGVSPSFLAYADDTVLISNSAQSHQNLSDLFYAKTSEIGLILRPDKCISWKVERKKIESFSVNIGENTSRSLATKPEKYLGVLQCIGGCQEASKILLKDFKIKCDRLFNYRYISNVIKEKMFRLYLLPSYYFIFMTSEISSQTLESINELQKKFSSLNEDEPSISQPISGLYQKFQILSYIFKLYSDKMVQEAVYRKLERDSNNRLIEIALYLVICTTSLQKARNLFRKIFRVDPIIIDEYPKE